MLLVFLPCGACLAPGSFRYEGVEITLQAPRPDAVSGLCLALGDDNCLAKELFVHVGRSHGHRAEFLGRIWYPALSLGVWMQALQQRCVQAASSRFPPFVSMGKLPRQRY